MKNINVVEKFVNSHRAITKKEYNTILENKLTYKAKDRDDLKNIIDLVIKGVGPNADLNWIDVSAITDMSCLFERSNFNGDVSKWDVSNVTTMYAMFAYSKFAGNISNWNVSNVKDMGAMFMYNKSFYRDISKWQPKSVKNMSCMFKNSKFNGDLSTWSISDEVRTDEIFSKNNYMKEIPAWVK